VQCANSFVTTSQISALSTLWLHPITCIMHACHLAVAIVIILSFQFWIWKRWVYACYKTVTFEYSFCDDIVRIWGVFLGWCWRKRATRAKQTLLLLSVTWWVINFFNWCHVSWLTTGRRCWRYVEWSWSFI